jgi:hypothetical protein
MTEWLVHRFVSPLRDQISQPMQAGSRETDLLADVLNFPSYLDHSVTTCAASHTSTLALARSHTCLYCRNVTLPDSPCKKIKV